MGLVGRDASDVGNTNSGSATIVTAVSNRQTAETDGEDDDEGPFFDMEFSVPVEDESETIVERLNKGGEDGDVREEDEDEEEIESFVTDGEREEFNFTLSSGSSGSQTDPDLSASPSNNLFFNGKLVPVEPSSLVFNAAEVNSKSQFPVSLLKSATKLRVFALGLKKTRSSVAEKAESGGTMEENSSLQHKQQAEAQQRPQSKFFTVKFKVEEVPIVSLFTRDNSSRGSSSNKAQKQNTDESASDEKRFSKDVMQRYLKMVKPLYVRVSRKYGEKLKSGEINVGANAKAEGSAATNAKCETEGELIETTTSNVKGLKQATLPAGLKVVCKHLGKSRSASSAVAAVQTATIQARRRDDSLLQQQDGIQSAIQHCKRSFNASRDSHSSNLSRSSSDPSRDKSNEQ